MDASKLLNPERRMLKLMQSDSSKKWSLEEVLSSCNWSDQAVAVGAGLGLSDAGFVEIEESVETVIRLSSQGASAIENGLLESRLWSWISNSDSADMASLQQSFERHEAGPGVGLLKRIGVQLDGGKFVASDPGKVEKEISQRTNFLSSLPDLVENLDSEMVEHFRGRKGFIENQESTTRSWKINQNGLSVSSDLLVEKEMITEITPELLQSDNWRDSEFRSFDVTLESATPRTGRSHPMQALIERIRSIFLEMGFSELVEDYVQTAGWNMDALFIPQDHPAREMQDTFYLDNPASMELPDDVMSLWSGIHKHGGDTGSVGWGGDFSKETSQKGLLRTHTTVNTIQYLAENPSKPCRMFTVDRVFRKEAIDRTHLPEFHQIEGIIMEEGANLQMLVTTLKTFYHKMGYPEVRVRPAYFPYTEPSLEIEVKWRGKWLELGGAGIFRPEVTEPLGITTPVLAWGMGLERLAMLVLGLDDIRQLYISDLEWLRNQPII
uniref:phenylalanine--tRNA ligase n=1 Tax=uncultured Poseidoniia archaeon TaxID=1697135 RepID=A0A1B1TE48_9ARCH|nr:phenylalanyl-tRNA synthetase subunit alpha [uncultured Candidatus Thalassoarchaea sp.]